MSRKVSVVLAAVVAALLLALCGGGSHPALAHAIPIGSDPADGAVLATAPKQIHLWFTQAVEIKLTRTALYDSKNIPITISAAHADTTGPYAAVTSKNADSAVAIAVDVSPLNPGAYRLEWSAISADDLHLTRGSVIFGVNSPADIARLNQPAPGPSPIETLFTWLRFGALASVIGGLLLLALSQLSAERRPLLGAQLRTFWQPSSTLLAADGPAGSLRRRLLWLMLGASAVALLSGIALLLAQGTTLGNAEGNLLAKSWNVLTETGYGARWIWLSILFIGSGLAAGHWLSLEGALPRLPLPEPLKSWLRLTPGILYSVLALMGVVSVGLLAAQTHLVATDDASFFQFLIAFIHLSGAMIWSGGLLALAVGIVPLLSGGAATLVEAWSILRRFGVVAVVGLIALGVTGLYAAGLVIATPDALFFSGYGQTLLLKIGLILAVGVVGILNSAMFHPRVAAVLATILRRPAGWRPLNSAQLARTLMIEAGGALGIILLAALLGASQPARGPAYDPIQPTVLMASAPANDLFVTLAIRPNYPGQNFITIGVYDVRRPALAPIDSVDVRLQPPNGEASTTQQAQPIDANRYQITGTMITTPGTWHFTTTAHRAGLPDATVTLPWTVLPPLSTARKPTIISQQSLTPWADGASLALILLVAASAGLLWWQRRRRSTIATDPLVESTDQHDPSATLDDEAELQESLEISGATHVTTSHH